MVCTFSPKEGHQKDWQKFKEFHYSSIDNLTLKYFKVNGKGSKARLQKCIDWSTLDPSEQKARQCFVQ